MIFNSQIVGKVKLTSERKKHILTSHPELKLHFSKISQVLQTPDEIRRSRIDPQVLLFYKYFDTIKQGKFIQVAVKTGERNFILTSYLTDKIKAGKPYETEKKPL